MDLKTLKAPAGSRKKCKRIGRGGDHGGTAGKGHKGQKARSGGGVKPGLKADRCPWPGDCPSVVSAIPSEGK